LFSKRFRGCSWKLELIAGQTCHALPVSDLYGIHCHNIADVKEEEEEEETGGRGG
jgi:hypothetical protein